MLNLTELWRKKGRRHFKITPETKEWKHSASHLKHLLLKHFCIWCKEDCIKPKPLVFLSQKRKSCKRINRVRQQKCLNSGYWSVAEHNKSGTLKQNRLSRFVPHLIKEARRAGLSGLYVMTPAWQPLYFSQFEAYCSKQVAQLLLLWAYVSLFY